MEHTHGKNGEKTILVVDDDPIALSFTSVFLKKHFNVLVAKNGKDALQQSETFKHEIHLLLTDFQMKEMNGTELATKIAVQRPDIKIVIMSGLPQEMLGLNREWHFLAKPFMPSELLNLITNLILPKSHRSEHGTESSMG
jgi:two-component system, cell cycle sensor histidine kinase and response regulator CckA